MPSASPENVEAPARAMKGDRVAGNCELRGAFVRNLKLGGSVHRIAPESQRLPRFRRRTICGWNYDGVGTLISAAFLHVDESFHRCQKCFPKTGTRIAVRRDSKRGPEFAQLQQQGENTSKVRAPNDSEEARDPIQEYLD